MGIERDRADLPNLGEEFLDNDPQQGSSINRFPKLQEQVDKRPIDADDILPSPITYGDDVVLGEDQGAMDTEFMLPAEGQPMYADEEPSGMYGSTQDELMGSDSPDAVDLGSPSEKLNYGHIERTLSGGDNEGLSTEGVPLGNVKSSDGMEDQLSTDLPAGGTYGHTSGPIIDPDSGELTDYDDAEQPEEVY